MHFKIIGNELNHRRLSLYTANKLDMPHESLFLTILLTKELSKNPKIVYPLDLFIREYYPDYKWNTKTLNPELRITMEAALCSFNFTKVYEYNIEPVESLTYSMEFGEIVTDFLIRYCNYSLIDFAHNNIILTAQSDCEKRFEEYLKEGYTLHRYAKLYYDENKHELYKLPVFPTEESYIPINEVIESSDGEYRHVLSKK